MKLGYICFAIGASIILNAVNVHAQNSGIFGGQGFREIDQQAEPAAKPKWPKLFGSKSKPEPQRQQSIQPFSGMSGRKMNTDLPERAQSAFSLPKFQKPSFDWMKKKPSLFDSENSAKPFAGLSNMFPKRDTSKPGLFTQMNSKSKEFIGRTTGWTQRKNENLKAKSFETWDSITKDMIKFEREEAASNRGMLPAQPPVRTAEATDKPRVRF